jgi:hypothetical protein
MVKELLGGFDLDGSAIAVSKVRGPPTSAAASFMRWIVRLVTPLA